MANTIRVPNQKKIISTIKEPCNEIHYYAKINLDVMHNAMLQLSGEHFKSGFIFQKTNQTIAFCYPAKKYASFAVLVEILTIKQSLK